MITHAINAKANLLVINADLKASILDESIQVDIVVIFKFVYSYRNPPKIVEDSYPDPEKILFFFRITLILVMSE